MPDLNRRANELAVSYINGNTGSTAERIEADPMAAALALAVVAILRDLDSSGNTAARLQRRLCGFDPHMIAIDDDQEDD